jgi:hypothetical protein
MIKFSIFLKVLLVLGLIFIGGLFFNQASFVNADNLQEKNLTFYPLDGCPPQCEWGCYTNGECCTKPDPGEPFCNEEPY